LLSCSFKSISSCVRPYMSIICARMILKSLVETQDQNWCSLLNDASWVFLEAYEIYFWSHVDLKKVDLLVWGLTCRCPAKDRSESLWLKHMIIHHVCWLWRLKYPLLSYSSKCRSFCVGLTWGIPASKFLNDFVMVVFGCRNSSNFLT